MLRYRYWFRRQNLQTKIIFWIGFSLTKYYYSLFLHCTIEAWYFPCFRTYLTRSRVNTTRGCLMRTRVSGTPSGWSGTLLGRWPAPTPPSSFRSGPFFLSVAGPVLCPVRKWIKHVQACAKITSVLVLFQSVCFFARVYIFILPRSFSGNMWNVEPWTAPNTAYLLVYTLYL